MYIKVDHAPRSCDWCGEDFKPKTSHQRFCNHLHYSYYGKKFLNHSRGDVAGQIKRLDKRKRPYRAFVKDQCERCGFIPEHLCQLDVDHKDADHKNNAPENLQTLCANCHRLKTFEGRDWEPLG